MYTHFIDESDMTVHVHIEIAMLPYLNVNFGK